MINESRQDVLDENESVVVELEDGSRLVEIVDPDSYRDRFSYRVETVYAGTNTFDDERRAKLMLDLYVVVDGFERPESVAVAIPLDVVLAGRAAVATYLYAVRGWSSESVADRLDVSRRTVWEYLSDVRREADLF